MGDHLGLERYWFDARVHAELFPNAATLAGQFEISSKTAQRSIDFMRDRFGAPLEYDPSRKGYRYSDESFSPPSRFRRRRWSQSFWRETSSPTVPKA